MLAAMSPENSTRLPALSFSRTLRQNTNATPVAALENAAVFASANAEARTTAHPNSFANAYRHPKTPLA